MATGFGIGSPQNLWGLTPYGGQTMGSFPGQGFGIGQPHTQQIIQSLQAVPQQLHLLQHQLVQLQQLQQYLQQLLQAIPVQLQQLQQLVQFIPQLQQQQQPFGQQFGMTGLPFQPTSTLSPFAGQSVM